MMHFIPDGVTAQNIGYFPMSEAFTSADAPTLGKMSALIAGMPRFGAIGETVARLAASDELAQQILGSYLGTVAAHAATLDVSWHIVDGSPLVQVTRDLVTSSRNEGRAHRDTEDRPGEGMRLVTANVAPTTVVGAEDLKAGQVARMIHGRTLHNIPEYWANRRHPRLRISTDFYTYDPS